MTASWRTVEVENKKLTLERRITENYWHQHSNKHNNCRCESGYFLVGMEGKIQEIDVKGRSVMVNSNFKKLGFEF